MSWRISTVGSRLCIALVVLLSAACSDSSGGERTCGDGTEEIDGECLSELACGDGTSEENGACVPSRDGLTCGVGTRRQDNTCVSLS